MTLTTYTKIPFLFCSNGIFSSSPPIFSHSWMSIVISVSGSRWKSRRLLSSPPRNTLNLQLQKNNSLWKKCRNQLSYVYTSGEQEKTHLTMGGRDWDTTSPQTPPSVLWHIPAGTSHSQLLPEEQRVWTPHLAPQLSRLPPDRWVPKTSSFESQ